MVGKITAYLGKQSRISIVSCAMALVATIGFLDFVTGYEAHLVAFYVAPVSLAAWYAGRLPGIIVAIVSVITSVLADIGAGYTVSHPAIILWNTAALIGFFIVLVIALVKLRMANETLESLIQMVAHDLKSPVISMVGLVRALRRHSCNLTLDEKRDRILDQLENSGETMEKFLEDLLDGLVSEHSEPVREEVRMDQTVRECVQQHHQTIEERGINVQLEIAPNLASVWADPHRVRQVIDNIRDFCKTEGIPIFRYFWRSGLSFFRKDRIMSRVFEPDFGLFRPSGRTSPFRGASLQPFGG